jgi:hypothetical protein
MARGLRGTGHARSDCAQIPQDGDWGSDALPRRGVWPEQNTGTSFPLMSHAPIRNTRCRPTRPGSQRISRKHREVNTLSHNRLDATVLRSAVASIRTIWRATPLLVVTIMLALVGCSESTKPSTTTTATATATTLPPAPPRLPSEPLQPRLASDPVQMADDLVADEMALRDPSSSETVLMAAAHRQQAAYRALGRHPRGTRSRARGSRRRSLKSTTAMSPRVGSSPR